MRSPTMCDQQSDQSLSKSLEYTILKPRANWSPYIFTLVQKVKHRVYKIYAFLNEAIHCPDSASYFI